MSMTQLDTAFGSRAVVVRSGEGQTLRWGPAGKVRIVAEAGSTDTSFSIVEITDAPGAGAPLHVHHGEAEGFYILDGAIEFTCATQTVVGHAGDFLYAPMNVPHKFLVLGDKPARFLMFFSRPGFEQFFAEGGTPLDQPPSGPPDPDAFRRLVEKYGMELLDTPFCH